MQATIHFTNDHYAPNCTGGVFGVPGVLGIVGGACSGAWSDPASTVVWTVYGRDDDGVNISVDTRYLACKWWLFEVSYSERRRSRRYIC